MNDLEAALARYLAHRMPSAGNVRITGLSRIHGGSSQETYSYEAHWIEDGKNREGDFILRRSPEAGLVNAEHDLEFTVYSALADSGIPTPEAFYLELDRQWLERPFFIMNRVPGKPAQFLTDDPYEGQSQPVGVQFWTILGTLAMLDPQALGLMSLRGGQPSELAQPVHERELAYWEERLDAGEDVVEPLIRGAIRWLRRNPPPPPSRLAVVHGDYRSGNFLFLPDGEISAILDWEMCHLGDPLEDIAWALDPMWSIGRNFDQERGLEIWQQVSGMTIDREALDWWRLFAAVKCSAIWTTAEKSVEEGTSREMVLGMTVSRAGPFHRGVLLKAMEQRGVMG
jgi:aminoglycoside phosphotransferase (APT) family kinase protein